MDGGNDDVFSVSRDVHFSLGGSHTTDNVSDNVSVDGNIRFRSTIGRRRRRISLGAIPFGSQESSSLEHDGKRIKISRLALQISVSLSKLPGPIISFNDRTAVSLNFAEFMRRPVKMNPNCTVMLLRRVYIEYNVR